MFTPLSKRSSDGIFYLSAVNDGFEENYLALRKKEGYLLSPNEIKKLPQAFANKENWSIRGQSALKIREYITKRSSHLTILELGCGNGWFCNYVSQELNVSQVTGLDVNQFELRLAYEAFASNAKLQLIYADIFTAPIANGSFDIIILNSSVQYFPDLTRLLSYLKKLLKPNGEIHILDSPFYKTSNEQKKAAERSASYFSSMGFPEMAKHYTPHLLSEIEKFDPEIMYRPTFSKTILRKLKLSKTIENPFSWFKIS